MNDKLLTPKEAAIQLRVSTATLEAWRATRKGPAWIKLGDSPRGPIRYRQAALDEYLKQNTN
ncbi:MAG: hypothetical protein RJA36_916 [Pseudomonadota bacterium]